MTKIVKFLKPYMGATVAALFFLLFNNLMQLILPAMMALMINTGIGDGRMGTVQLIGGVMAVLSAIAIGAAIAGSYYSSKVSACFGLSLRRALFVKVESLSQCDIDKIGTPSLITRTTNDIRQIQDMILMMIRIIISAPIVMVGGAFMAFTLNKKALDRHVHRYSDNFGYRPRRRKAGSADVRQGAEKDRQTQSHPAREAQRNQSYPRVQPLGI